LAASGAFTRLALERTDLEVVAVNDITNAGTGTLVKVFGWYDNEWGYTCRLADLAALVGGRL
jgi:glyceraldehyde-3-phosphate dehydrogenase/erythrose-4-phosphate dehydrogenase